MHDIKRILIIEDNKMDQITYQRYLTQKFPVSIDIILKENGQGALEFLIDNIVDSIILDYQLPDMTGLEFLNQLKKLNGSAPPVLMLTGQGNEKVAVSALKLGVYDYITKSDINAQLLYDALKSAAEAHFLKKNVGVENEIRHIAYHDYLTGLPNRLYFEHVLTKALAYAKRHQKMFGILFFDLDEFKIINDACGHDAGDALLKQIANRIKSVLREEDMLARMGGDEFTILINDLNAENEASIIAQKLLRTMHMPMSLGTQEKYVTLSIGIAIYPFAGNTTTELLKAADTAMYQVKKTGKNNFGFYITPTTLHARR